jgi:hypothetical protein
MRWVAQARWLGRPSQWQFLVRSNKLKDNAVRTKDSAVDMLMPMVPRERVVIRAGVVDLL